MNQVQSVATIPARPRGIAVAVQSAVAAMTKPAEEISTITKPSVVDHDLEVAVDAIIEKAKEETKPVVELAAVEVPVIELSTLVDFVPVKNKQGRYRMTLPALRMFIFDSMDTRVVESAMVETPIDDANTKAARLRLSIQSLEMFFQYFGDFADIKEEDILASDSGLTWAQYQVFFADLKTRYDVYAAEREAEIAAKRKKHLDAFDSGIVSFDDLEYGLREESGKQTEYIFRDGDQNLAGMLTHVRREESMMGPYLVLYVRVYSRNEQGLNKVTHQINVFAFPETATLESLHITKLDKDSDVVKALIARGEKYLTLTQKPEYALSTGNMTRKVGRTVEVLNAQGRVMIDLEGMTNMDTNYYQYFCKADEGTKVIQFKDIASVEDEIKYACVPYVYGFSFKAKRWGQMNIADMNPIQFREDAYNMLVLDQGTKDLIFASVTDTQTDNDIIAGKGGGSINLLEGPPGVGKTLTAEAVAEMLKKPLYMVSVGELGTTVDELESKLADILEIAATWKAILLLDEADIFLETRDKHDVVRNAMVAVFLRLLEYYQGVMFLTTNRADNIDPAFESRITLCIHYSDLTFDSRVEVWTNLMKSAKLNRVFDINQLAGHKLNGRQIKGVIKSARNLARFNEEELDVEHFEEVIAQKAEFKAATVYKLGHGLDDHAVVGDDIALDKKPGLWKRILKAIVG